MDEAFPREPFEALGYNVAVHGQKTFNGVAILSKFKFDEVTPRLPGDDATTMPASSRRRSRPRPARCGWRRSTCPTATRRTPKNIHTKSNGWSGFSNMHMNGLQLEEPLVLAGDYNVIPAAADVHNPAAWVERRAVPAADPGEIPRADQSRPDRRHPRGQRRRRALHLLGLSGRRLAEELRHPHRPPAAVAAGRRPADHRGHRQARARLGEAVRPRAGLCRSGYRARPEAAVRIRAASALSSRRPSTQRSSRISASARSSSVACLHRGLAQLGDPRLLGARPVAGDGEPHQADARWRDAVLAVEQHAAEQRLRLVVALVGGEHEPRHRALADRARRRCRRDRARRADTAPRDRRNRTRHGRTSGARAPGSASPPCWGCRRDNSGRARRRRWRRSAPAASPDCRRHGVSANFWKYSNAR